LSDPSFLEPLFDDDEETPGFAHRRARLGRQAGAEHLGASLYELPPGVAVCPYHWHAIEEEVAIALTTGVSCRTPEGWRAMERGEVVAFPPGPDGAHQLANFGEEPVRLLFLSQSSRFEICGYPDSGKVMADAQDSDVYFMFREADAVDYFEGESGPTPP
jgi:uncharacterized cupin superfamily protein